MNEYMSICPRCTIRFTCAMADQTGQPCWCTTLPIESVLPIYPELSNNGDPNCFCPACLQEWKKISSSSAKNQ